ncbi:hypothetical protein CRUP_036264 [Coryphaenoides rupestris]|nr:hypothetical protein CRUP_036264 [Coryphaenoides rupestris]
MLRGESETVLVSFSKAKTEGWENATAFIGNQPGGYKPQAPSWIRTRGPQPDNSSSPASDHTLGTELGFYLSAQLWRHPVGTAVGMLSSLMNPTRRGGECWMFWYHMEGEDVGQLTVSLQHPEVPRSTPAPQNWNWTRSGDQGPHWRHARVTTSVGGSCPAERECTFQSSLCGLKPQAHPDLSSRAPSHAWDLSEATQPTRGPQPDNSSSPASDHTLGTELGFYLSAQLWRHPVGTAVGMLSSLMNPTRRGGECWMFWYHMEGEDVGQLTVSLQHPEVPRSTPAPQNWNWTRSGDQGPHWRHARVVFSVLRDPSTNSTVQLDDVSVTDGPCAPPGTCDFDSGMGTWVSVPAEEGGGHETLCELFVR